MVLVVWWLDVVSSRGAFGGVGLFLSLGDEAGA